MQRIHAPNTVADVWAQVTDVMATNPAVAMVVVVIACALFATWAAR